MKWTCMTLLQKQCTTTWTIQEQLNVNCEIKELMSKLHPKSQKSEKDLKSSSSEDPIITGQITAIKN
ncbi:hypothetical protein TNCV_2650601 [Trichonephila clavipes]|nr:hypothetical protein TNCV_2650601 [Trichonephila clavipes]